MSVLDQIKKFTTIVADSGDFECKYHNVYIRPHFF